MVFHFLVKFILRCFMNTSGNFLLFSFLMDCCHKETSCWFLYVCLLLYWKSPDHLDLWILICGRTQSLYFSLQSILTLYIIHHSPGLNIIYTHTYKNICIVYVGICILYVCVYIHTHIYIYTHSYSIYNVKIYVCIYTVCVYIHICIYIFYIIYVYMHIQYI